MTLDEFFTTLEQTPREWRMNKRGAIRCSLGCPIIAVYRKRLGGTRLGLYQYLTAARALGLDRDTAIEIALRADTPFTPYPEHVHLRARLLAACGLPT
jgi:hypothetical protein